MTNEQMDLFFQRLLAVAIGGPATELRHTVQQMFPTDPEEAKAFLQMIQRMKTALEAVQSVATECHAYAIRDNG